MFANNVSTGTGPSRTNVTAAIITTTAQPKQRVFVDDIDGDVIQIDAPAVVACRMEVPGAGALPMTGMAPVAVVGGAGLCLGDFGEAIDHHRSQAARTCTGIHDCTIVSFGFPSRQRMKLNTKTEAPAAFSSHLCLG